MAFDWAAAGLSALDSLGSGLSDTFFGGIKARRQWKYQQKQMALQHQYNLDEMWYEQQYNEANMAKQFEYQQKAWQAENEYNDPSAVAARYRAAGVSPQAALGGSASGAGLAMSMDTPSSSNPSAHGVSGGGDYSGGSNRSQGIIAGVLAQKQIEQVNQNINESRSRERKNDAETKGIEFQNSMQDIFRSIKESEALSKKYKAEVDKFEAKFAEASKIADLSERNARIDKLRVEYSKVLSDISVNEKEKEYTDALIGLTAAQTVTEGVRRENIESHTAKTEAETVTENELRDSRKNALDQSAALDEANAWLASNKAKGQAIENELAEWLKDQKIARKPTESYWEMALQAADRVIAWRNGSIQKEIAEEKGKNFSRSLVASILFRLLLKKL